MSGTVHPHSFKCESWAGSVSFDKQGHKKHLDRATLNGARVWIVRCYGSEAVVFDDAEACAEYYNSK